MYDYHSHSNISADGHAPMNEMVQAALNAGLLEIAITDHYDPDYADSNWPSDLDFPSYHTAMEETSDTFRGRIKVVKGIEIGLQHGETLQKCRNAAQSYDYDFIIGSFHCAEGIELSQGDFFDNRSVEEATTAFYEYCYQCLLEYEDFDVLGHLNIIDRYGPRIPTSSCYIDHVSEILTLLINKGKGIELNTSSFRYGMGNHTTPTEEILKRYYELGGEIITVGSDAHHPRHVASGLDWGYEKLRSLGYRYITTFDRRVPSFIKL